MARRSSWAGWCHLFSLSHQNAAAWTADDPRWLRPVRERKDSVDTWMSDTGQALMIGQLFPGGGASGDVPLLRLGSVTESRASWVKLDSWTSSNCPPPRTTHLLYLWSTLIYSCDVAAPGGGCVRSLFCFSVQCLTSFISSILYKILPTNITWMSQQLEEDVLNATFCTTLSFCTSEHIYGFSLQLVRV